ncbi:multicopper oxidase domain-containing protein [Oxalobacteraceae bacterium R-40]|uniref:Multicopper oxidase domain-containing protein n=1 Tax=Keguizhuia sedimenti TaxID=3064264 RepID=A0ABU1BSZ2_9BURK|nr:multicopper oxidase domain-containing protein [Oxalobacteraceae bacterium R-40]
MKRRNFILGSTAAIAASSGLLFAMRSSIAWWPNSGSRPRLSMPKLIDTTTAGAFTITARAGQTEFLSGVPSATQGFNQTYLGPVVKVRTGTTVTATVINELNDSLAVHWHGLVIPGDRDGGPHQAIKPGGTWKPRLDIDQPAATVWYHAHTHDTTAPLVYSGLAGVMLIVDGKDNERGLPSDYGIDDLVLVLQDRRFDASGRMVYRPGMMDRMAGFHGDRMLVNGALDPSAAVPRSVVRLRLINGSNARIYNLVFDDRRTMQLIATDSGLLPRPVELERLRLAPGERAEVLVDFSSGKPAMLSSEEYVLSGGGMMAMMGNPPSLSGASAGNNGAAPILAFEPAADLPAKVTTIPAVLDDNPVQQLAPPARSRFLSMDMMVGGPGGMMGGGMMGQMGINGQPFSMERIDQRIARGSVEMWTVRSTMRPHPLHIHGVRFRIVSENGQPPRMENVGWKDTVLVEDEVELLAEFTRPAAADTPFMYHCHILEHEDAGMMGQFVVA